MQELLDNESTSKNKSSVSPSKIKELARPKRQSIEVDYKVRKDKIGSHS